MTLVCLTLAACGGSGDASSPTSPGAFAPIPGLSPTASNLAGVADTRWQYTCAVSPGFDAFPCPIPGPSQAIAVADGFSEWVHPGGAGRPDWVGIDADATVVDTGPGDDQPRYTYVFRTTFDLSGFDASTATITLDFAVDNYSGGWRVNNGALRDQSSDGGQWRTTKKLTINASNATFVEGANSLEFRVLGDGITDGLLVSSISGTARRR